MANFCKHAKCPSSEDLLAFQKGEMSSKEVRKLKKHIESCEFCEAELDMYQHFPQPEESLTTVEIPLPLYELAQALLSRKQQNFLLNKLINESESLSHT